MDRSLNQPLTLPSLREEVHCLDGPVQYDGSPSWTLHDPANNRFFRIGWLEHEILSRWSMADPELIAQAIAQETVLQVELTDIMKFAEFLSGHQLLNPVSPEAIQRLKHLAAANRKNPLQWLIHNYLFFKVPLFRPDPFLQRIYPYLRWIYSRQFLYAMLVSWLVSLYLISRQWDVFLNTFSSFFNWYGIAQYFAALTFAKVLHELGHALTAHRFGCRVPTMGVAFMVMYPMLYTDANELWKLNKRSQRLAIGSAGVIAELILAVIAGILWNVVADGPLRSALFLLASSTWVMTLLVNLSPFMRFDGYYLLADWVKIENLQPRAFAYTRWKLRAFFFGDQTEAPEKVPRNTAIFYLLYSWGTWLYRLFLFLGIAWMVYQYFFKILGIFLMLVEVIWFVAKPIWMELKDWPALFRHKPSVRLSVAGLVLALVFLLPWQSHQLLPAVLKPAQYAELYLPYPARLDEWRVAIGQSVNEGDVLISLSSSDLNYKAQTAGLESQTFAWELAFKGMDRQLVKQRQIQMKQAESAFTRQQGYQRQIEQLQLHSPIAGVVHYINDSAQAGQWLKASESLIIVADPHNWQLEAFVSEQAVVSIQPGAEAWFYPDSPDLPSLPCRVKAIEHSNSPVMSPLMASVYGGPIASRKNAEGRAIPDDAQYRVILEAMESDVERSAPLVIRGVVRVDSDSSSLIGQLWTKVLATIRREAGF